MHKPKHISNYIKCSSYYTECSHLTYKIVALVSWHFCHWFDKFYYNLNNIFQLVLDRSHTCNYILFVTAYCKHGMLFR